MKAVKYYSHNVLYSESDNFELKNYEEGNNKNNKQTWHTQYKRQKKEGKSRTEDATTGNNCTTYYVMALLQCISRYGTLW